MTSDDKSKAAINLKILLLQRKGGRTSGRIIEKLLERPYNPNQIAELLGVSYNTAYYHMQIMKKYGLIEKKTNNYGSLYEPTDALLSQKELFYKLKELI